MTDTTKMTAATEAALQLLQEREGKATKVHARTFRALVDLGYAERDPNSDARESAGRAYVWTTLTKVGKKVKLPKAVPSACETGACPVEA